MPFFWTYPGLSFLKCLFLWCCSRIYIYIYCSTQRNSGFTQIAILAIYCRQILEICGQEQPIMERLSEPRMDLRADARSLRALPMGWDTIRNRKWRALNCVYWWLVMGFQLLHTVAAGSWLKTAQYHTCTFQGRSRMSLTWLIKLWCTKDRLAKIFLEVSAFSSGNTEGANERERETEKEKEKEKERSMSIHR